MAWPRLTARFATTAIAAGVRHPSPPIPLFRTPCRTSPPPPPSPGFRHLFTFPNRAPLPPPGPAAHLPASRRRRGRRRRSRDGGGGNRARGVERGDGRARDLLIPKQLIVVVDLLLVNIRPAVTPTAAAAAAEIGLAKTMQRDLNAIAIKVDTTKQRRYKFMLRETICSLNRHKDYCVSATISSDVKWTVDKVNSWEEHFDKISIEERSKTDEETLFNVEGIGMIKKYSKEPEDGKKEFIVLTIILAADGKLKFPKIRNTTDLITVLGMLNGVHATEIKGIQIIWTPQHEDDVLSEERLLKDYPYLKPGRSSSSSSMVTRPPPVTTPLAARHDTIPDDPDEPPRKRNPAPLLAAAAAAVASPRAALALSGGSMGGCSSSSSYSSSSSSSSDSSSSWSSSGSSWGSSSFSSPKKRRRRWRRQIWRRLTNRSARRLLHHRP
uniref:Uncharacterized protein n=1 Tax=Leersia perrieri TaxID=77586 RepID=A0A0D9X3X8_9ORYZ